MPTKDEPLLCVKHDAAVIYTTTDQHVPSEMAGRAADNANKLSQMSNCASRIFTDGAARDHAATAIAQWLSHYTDKPLPFPVANIRDANDDVEHWVLIAAIHDATCRSVPAVVQSPDWMEDSEYRRYHTLVGMVESLIDDAERSPDASTYFLQAVSVAQTRHEHNTRHIGVEQVTHSADANCPYVFRRDGDKWFVRFGDESGHYDDIDGFRYLHLLIDDWKTYREDKPDKGLGAIELLQAKTLPELQRLKRHAVPLEADEADETITLGIHPKSNLVLDRDAISELRREIEATRQRVAEIEGDIDRGRDDPELLRLSLTEEQDKLKKLLSRLTGDTFCGRSKQAGTDAATRGRQTVGKAIKRAVKRLRGKGMPNLAEHLERAIPDADGAVFRYRPSPESVVVWNLDKSDCVTPAFTT